MKILIEVIPHEEQRYETVGDWAVDIPKKHIQIRVSDCDNWKMEFLVGFHELIETVLCMDRGVTAEVVDKFDIEYEAQRDVDDKSEPGDSPNAPYRKEHFFATSLERLMAAELGVSWLEYENRLEELGA